MVLPHRIISKYGQWLTGRVFGWVSIWNFNQIKRFAAICIDGRQKTIWV
jgi:hypothetical protein